ncbi:hypothetical protein VARIO8X_110088 [Burkholderiales bacterium 8X]|nr:hypothetical protein VARIO8X_110088 [Burkholderiales bacterium 8X]
MQTMTAEQIRAFVARLDIMRRWAASHADGQEEKLALRREAPGFPTLRFTRPPPKKIEFSSKS